MAAECKQMNNSKPKELMKEHKIAANLLRAGNVEQSEEFVKMLEWVIMELGNEFAAGMKESTDLDQILRNVDEFVIPAFRSIFTAKRKLSKMSFERENLPAYENIARELMVRAILYRDHVDQPELPSSDLDLPADVTYRLHLALLETAQKTDDEDNNRVYHARKSQYFLERALAQQDDVGRVDLTVEEKGHILQEGIGHLNQIGLFNENFTRGEWLSSRVLNCFRWDSQDYETATRFFRERPNLSAQDVLDGAEEAAGYVLVAARTKNAEISDLLKQVKNVGFLLTHWDQVGEELDALVR